MTATGRVSPDNVHLTGRYWITDKGSQAVQEARTLRERTELREIELAAAQAKWARPGGKRTPVRH